MSAFSAGNALTPAKIWTGSSIICLYWQPCVCMPQAIMCMQNSATLSRTGSGRHPCLECCVWLQGNRITQGISCADVADVCVKSLHDTAARNQTFEVCYEYSPAKGLEMYELVAHLPDKSNNYLGPALAGLQKNT